LILRKGIPEREKRIKGKKLKGKKGKKGKRRKSIRAAAAYFIPSATSTHLLHLLSEERKGPEKGRTIGKGKKPSKVRHLFLFLGKNERCENRGKGKSRDHSSRRVNEKLWGRRRKRGKKGSGAIVSPSSFLYFTGKKERKPGEGGKEGTVFLISSLFRFFSVQVRKNW